MILSKRLSLRVADLYFDEEPVHVAADLIRYIQWSHPIPETLSTSFYTILIDLTRDIKSLEKDVDAKTRYDIRRAERETLVYDFWNNGDPDALDRFCKFYDDFASLKGLTPASRRRLGILVDNRALDISNIREKSGRALAWHASWRMRGRARQLHSATLYRASDDKTYRALVGRANRYHIWRDILRFKAEGLSLFDFGGWYSGSTDEQLLRINRFKEEFGGSVVQNFNCMRAATLKGGLALWFLSMLGRTAA